MGLSTFPGMNSQIGCSRLIFGVLSQGKAMRLFHRSKVRSFDRSDYLISNLRVRKNSRIVNKRNGSTRRGCEAGNRPSTAAKKGFKMPQTVHLQYNSPMGLYSKEAAVEQFQQQIGENPGDLPAPDKHFDPSKSATLKYLREAERDDGFGDNFFEKVAQAEAPNVPEQQEPYWARTAREKSERARSRTPADPTQGRYRPSSSPAPLNHPVHYESAREHAEKNKVFTNSVNQPWAPSYYESVAHRNHGRRAQSLGRDVPRGYELGGMDFTGGLPVDQGNDYFYYQQPRRATEKPKPAPGYELGGSDFYRGYVSTDGPYRGHGPDPPRLRPKYTADARDPCNVAIAPNVDEVDANLLVGDTLSNQKIKHEVRHIDQSEFGTSFAPPTGFKRDHLTVRQSPQPPQPTTFSISANRNRAASVPRSSQPPEQQNVWRQRQDYADKEVSIRTLLNDEAIRALPNKETQPHWAEHSLQKHQAWHQRVDPLLERYQTYISEPNWRRNVDQRRRAWEQRAFETEHQLTRANFDKNAPAAPPFWQDRAARTHEQWQRQANDMSTSSHYQASERSVPINYQYESRHETSNSVQQPQQHERSPYVTAQADANVQRLLNSGYNSNQVDYVLGHKDRFVDGQHYNPPVVNSGANINQQFSSSQFNRTTTNTQNNNNFGLQHPTSGNQNYSYHTETSRTTGVPNSGNHNYSYQTETSRVTGGPISGHNNFSSTNFGDQNHQQSFHSSSYSSQTKNIPVQPASNYQENYVQQAAIPLPVPNELHESQSNYNRTFNQSTTTQQQQLAPIALPAPQNHSTSYHTETHTTSQTPMMHSPGGQSYKSTEFSSSRHTKQETTTTTKTQPVFQTTTLPITRNTSYNYSQQQHQVQPPQPSLHQESYTSHNEKTSNSAPRQQPGSYHYENYHSSRKEENRREETSRPVSQLSQYSESRNYKRNYEEKTETTTIPAGVPVASGGNTTTTYKDLSNAQNVDDVFNKREEMAENLPLGSVSNTHNNTEGGYRDANGHDVSYKRETQTSADPNKETSLLKEEEKRVIETPLEPGVISRHVTTKYYKKKTVTDTTTTTTPA
ncbi:unnamed protein product [Caenorhabditis auriculariae]|uniref:Zasp-like motif domain-containing protein n=1 Tax=Caenorhabditis auriculariae TaxID=2777116 RepID=A0A8S1H7Y3_9PELO|nr:unnamed protein product [Caenorhabditis auriculariae]